MNEKTNKSYFVVVGIIVVVLVFATVFMFKDRGEEPMIVNDVTEEHNNRKAIANQWCIDNPGQCKGFDK